MRVTKTISTKDNLCKYCQLMIPTCPKANQLKFGNGIGNDNIIECSEFIVDGDFRRYPIDLMNKSVPLIKEEEDKK